MRITERMFRLDSLNAMKSADQEIIDLEYKIASAKEVNRPSDDPLRFVNAARFKSVVNSKEQFIRNIGDSRRALEENEGALNNVITILQRMRLLMVRSGNDTFTTADLRLTAKEMRQELDSLIQFANADGVNGKYFGGTRTDQDPFEVVKDANGEITKVVYRGNDDAISRQISEDSTIDVNFAGSKLFQVDPDERSSNPATFPASYAGETLNDAGIIAGDTTGYFSVQGRRIWFDTSQDSLLDLAARINDKAPQAVATVEGTLLGTAPVADPDAAIGSITEGTVNLNGVEMSIDAGASLRDIADAVNAITAQTGVTATIEQGAGGYALRLDGGVEIDDVHAGSSSAFFDLGITDGSAAPANLLTADAAGLSYTLKIATSEPDQLMIDDLGSGGLLRRLGLTDGSNAAPENANGGAESDTSFFDVLIRAIGDLENGRTADIRSDRLAEMDRGLERFLDIAGEIGGMAARLENAEEREEEMILQAKQVISDSEDLDFAEAVSNLRMAQYRLQTALAAASNVPGQNLLQFL